MRGAERIAPHEPFCSEIREHLLGQTQALQDLVVELLACDLLVPDIEDTFKDEIADPLDRWTARMARRASANADRPQESALSERSSKVL